MHTGRVLSFIAVAFLLYGCADPFNPVVQVAPRANELPEPSEQGGNGGCYVFLADDHGLDAVWGTGGCAWLAAFSGQTFYGQLISDSLWGVTYGDNVFPAGPDFQLVYYVKANYYFLDGTGQFDVNLSRTEVVGAEFASLTSCGQNYACPRVFSPISFHSELPSEAIAVEFVGFPGRCPASFSDPIECAFSIRDSSNVWSHDEPRMCVQNPAYAPLFCDGVNKYNPSRLLYEPTALASLSFYQVLIDCPMEGPCGPSGHRCSIDASASINPFPGDLTYEVSTPSGLVTSTSPTFLYSIGGDVCPASVLTVRTQGGRTGTKALPSSDMW